LHLTQYVITPILLQSKFEISKNHSQQQGSNNYPKPFSLKHDHPGHDKKCHYVEKQKINGDKTHMVEKEGCPLDIAHVEERWQKRNKMQ